MYSNENWVRDQVLAAHEKIERDRRRNARNEADRQKHAAAYAKFSERAYVRIGAFLEREFGTQSISELAALPRNTTDAALMKFRNSFVDEIEGLQGEQTKKRTPIVVTGALLVLAGVGLLLVNGAIATIVSIAGVIVVAAAYGSFPGTPTPISGNPDLYLLLRCQQAAEQIMRIINEKRVDLGL